MICTCPDSPISAENDFYPHPPNITNATQEAPQASAASVHAQTRAMYPVVLRSMALPRHSSLAFSPFSPSGIEYEQPSRSGLAYNWAAVPPPFSGPAALSPARLRHGPQGLWIGAPPPMNPPNGDYPVRAPFPPSLPTPSRQIH